MGHARLPPSSAYRWSICTASPHEEAGRPDSGNDAARWGTAAHLLSETCLRDEFQLAEPATYLGCKVLFVYHPGSDSHTEILHDGFTDIAAADLDVKHTIEVDQELVDCAAAYVGFVRDLVVNTGGTLHVEVRVAISHITGEEGAGGTSDTVIDSPDEFMVVDLKGGKGKVDAYTETGRDLFTGEITTEPNSQLAMYGDGAITQLRPDLLDKPDHPVRLVIVQPRLNHISEHRTTVGELLAFTQKLREAATAVELNPVHAPDPDRCHFCKANGDCAGQREMLLEGFTGVQPEKLDGDQLGLFYDLIPLFTVAAKAAEQRVREKLSAGEPVVGAKGPYFLGEGRLGARAYTDEVAVEELVKGFRLKQELTHTVKFKTPTQLEEAIAKEMPRRWAKVIPLIKQNRCEPSIERAGSKKKPYVVETATDGFTDVSTTDSAAPETVN